MVGCWAVMVGGGMVDCGWWDGGWVVGGEWVVSGCIGLHVNRVHHCVARELDTPLGYTYQSAPDQLLEHIIRHAWVV